MSKDGGAVGARTFFPDLSLGLGTCQRMVEASGPTPFPGPKGLDGPRV